LHGSGVDFKLPFRCDLENNLNEFTFNFAFLVPKQSLTFSSPPSRKVKKQNNFDLHRSIVLQEGCEKFELELRKQ
jgi:hypothetical protein